MGEVRTMVLLENAADKALLQRGIIRNGEARKAQVEALVDTDAVMVLLPQDLVEKLGLQVTRKEIVTLANEEKVELPVARPLLLTIGDREMDTDCLVGPPQCEPLIGQLVLERLDLIPDPVNKTLHPRPESPFLPSLKLK